MYSHSGKTTVVHVIKHGEIDVATTPSIGVDFQIVKISELTILAWDYGGREAARPILLQNFRNIQAFIFVVDSSDRDRIDEAREQLHQIVNKDELKHKTILIFGNKQDVSNAMTPDELRDKLALAKLDGNTTWHFQAGSAIQNQGLKEGFEWLASTFRPKTDFTQPIVETLNDSTKLKDDLLSLFSVANLKKIWNKLIQF